MTRKKRSTWAVGVLLAASVLTGAPAAHAVPSPTDHGQPSVMKKPVGSDLTGGTAAYERRWIRNKANNDCMYPSGGAGAANYADGYCTQRAENDWDMWNNGDGTVTLYNWSYGTCAYAAGTTNNSYVKTWICGNHADQKWLKWDLGGGYFRLQNMNSKLCMVHRFADHGPVQQYTCGSYADQVWGFIWHSTNAV
jgi:hypothetical protein